MRAEELRNIGPRQPKISAEEVAKALGAEKMTPEEVTAFLRRIHGHTKRLEPCQICGRPHQADRKECNP